MNALHDAIDAAALPLQMPDGHSYRSLSLPHAQDIAQHNGLSLRRVELAALERQVIPQRYARNFKAWTLEQQVRLLKGAVLLVGLGGLGGGVLEILARAGVGRIIGADGDIFEESNCNRQLLCSTQTLGHPKSQAAAARMAAINPAVECRFLAEKLDKARMLQLLQELQAEEGPVVAVDALGGLESRPALWAAAQEASLPMVTAAVAGSSGCMGSFFPHEPGPELLFGGPSAGQKDHRQAAEDALGTQAPCVHLAASLEAQETLRLLGADPAAGTLQGRVLFFDLADLTFERVQF